MTDPAADFLAREEARLALLEGTAPPPNVITPTISVDAAAAAVTAPTNQPKTAEQKPPPPTTQPVQPPPPPAKVSTPEKVRRWRDDQAKRHAQMDNDEEQASMQLQMQAGRQLRDWYVNYEKQVESTKKANRQAETSAEVREQAMEADAEGTNAWERIVRLCDFQVGQKGSKCVKDLSRMRAVMTVLRREPIIPRKLRATTTDSEC